MDLNFRIPLCVQVHLNQASLILQARNLANTLGYTADFLSLTLLSFLFPVDLL